MAAHEAHDGESTTGPDSEGTGAETEDMKRKFREALDAKKELHHGSESAVDPGKIHETHGQAAHKREFRRKSG